MTEPLVDQEPVELQKPGVLAGNLRMSVLFLALPVLAEQLLNFMVGFVDTVLAGHLGSEISAAATSAIGLAAYVNWLAELMYSLVGTGTTALVARNWGAGNRTEANRVSDCSISLACGLGLIGTATIYFLAPTLTAFISPEETSSELSERYLSIVCFGQVFTGVLLIGAAALRGAGNMWAPMWILGLVSVLNVIFSSVLVFAFDLGIDGIAYGTIGARLVGCALMLLILNRGNSDVHARVTWSAATDFSTIARIMRIGVPAVCDGILTWTGHFLFLKVIASVGTGETSRATFAAHIVGVQIEALNYLPAWAWGTAAATMIGQCLGAQDPRRAEKAGHEAALQATIMAAIVGVTFFLAAGSIYSLMNEDPLVGEFGVPALRLLALFEIPLALTIVYATAIRGAGNTVAPMIFNFVGIFFLRVPFGYWLAIPCGLGLTGAWAGMGIDVTVRAIACGLYFKLGRWKKQEV